METDDVIFVSRLRETSTSKKLFRELEKMKSPEIVEHKTVYRPWGKYTVIEEKEGFKVKTIVVKPGASLSLQYHNRRSEHWIVVSGTALVTVGEKEVLVRPNESTYIPMGEIHRLKNPGKVDVVLIEAQVGSYLGEDDIVRFDDVYGREGSK